jgi:hypothetical protein
MRTIDGRQRFNLINDVGCHRKVRALTFYRPNGGIALSSRREIQPKEVLPALGNCLNP